MDNILKLKIKNFYDLQKLRIQSGNRDHWKGADDIQLSEGDIKYLKDMSVRLEDSEKYAFKEIKKCVKNHSIWDGFLKEVKGCGETMAAVIISEIDIKRATTASKIMSICGLGLEKEWEVVYRDIENHDKKNPKIGEWKTKTVWGTSEGSAKGVIPKPKEIEIKREFESVTRCSEDLSIQRRREGQYTTYNGFLKTKMVGVLATCMIKSKSSYTTFYYDYKQRYENKPYQYKAGEKQITKMHLHKQAIRHMLKHFIQDLYEKWREVEGLDVRVPYNEEYLNKKHG